jgi:hypothetical protein
MISLSGLLKQIAVKHNIAVLVSSYLLSSVRCLFLVRLSWRFGALALRLEIAASQLLTGQDLSSWFKISVIQWLSGQDI